jgi:hypothetical protein
VRRQLVKWCLFNSRLHFKPSTRTRQSLAKPLTKCRQSYDKVEKPVLRRAERVSVPGHGLPGRFRAAGKKKTIPGERCTPLPGMVPLCKLAVFRPEDEQPAASG